MTTATAPAACAFSVLTLKPQVPRRISAIAPAGNPANWAAVHPASIVVGAENRAVRHRSFFGYENERLLRETPVSLLMVVPRIAMRAPTRH